MVDPVSDAVRYRLLSILDLRHVPFTPASPVFQPPVPLRFGGVAANLLFFERVLSNNRTGGNQQKTRDEMGLLGAAWIGTVITLMLTYRALIDWKGMFEAYR